jgi:hypothetical protein
VSAGEAAGIDAGFLTKPLRACMLPELRQKASAYAAQLEALARA